MKKLDKNLVRVDKNKSGICHHMMFEKEYLNELISIVEENHKDHFYNIFLKFVVDKDKSGASEYEIYFNFMLKKHPEKIKLRKLKWENSENIENENLDYISNHWYLRK